MSMKSINRPHHFEDILNHIVQGRKYYYLYHEKSQVPVKIQRNRLLDQSFFSGCWAAFIEAEQRYYNNLK